jgi:hypothetical protein
MTTFCEILLVGKKRLCLVSPSKGKPGVDFGWETIQFFSTKR